MSENDRIDRRRFFSVAAMTIAAAQLGTLASANAQSDSTVIDVNA